MFAIAVSFLVVCGTSSRTVVWVSGAAGVSAAKTVSARGVGAPCPSALSAAAAGTAGAKGASVSTASGAGAAAFATASSADTAADVSAAFLEARGFRVERLAGAFLAAGRSAGLGAGSGEVPPAPGAPFSCSAMALTPRYRAGSSRPSRRGAG